MPFFQNVPVNTAKDWADEVKLFCKDSLKLTNHKFMKQDNIKQCVIETDQPLTQIKQTNRKKGSMVVKRKPRKTPPIAARRPRPRPLCFLKNQPTPHPRIMQHATIIHSTISLGTVSTLSKIQKISQTEAAKVANAEAKKHRTVTRLLPKNAKKIPRIIRAAPQKSLYLNKKALKAP